MRHCERRVGTVHAGQVEVGVYVQQLGGGIGRRHQLVGESLGIGGVQVTHSVGWQHDLGTELREVQSVGQAEQGHAHALREGIAVGKVEIKRDTLLYYQ